MCEGCELFAKWCIKRERICSKCSKFQWNLPADSRLDWSSNFEDANFSAWNFRMENFETKSIFPVSRLLIQIRVIRVINSIFEVSKMKIRLRILKSENFKLDIPDWRFWKGQFRRFELLLEDERLQIQDHIFRSLHPHWP